MINARRALLLSAAGIAAALAAGLLPGTASAQFTPDTVTIAPAGRIARDGTLTLSGTYRCSSLRSGVVLIGAEATQGKKRAGTDGTVATCDNRVHSWRNSGHPLKKFSTGGADGRATLIELDTSHGLIPLPVILNSHSRRLTLGR
ncbi:DUF6299 family protein [Streptomyces sp. CAU 1734]|uniref:DUF6299 family protein n=1 Tax=Streptomyces sp. CAU 1734 TaxID=3140360 RepID=UPI003261BA4C